MLSRARDLSMIAAGPKPLMKSLRVKFTDEIDVACKSRCYLPRPPLRFGDCLVNNRAAPRNHIPVNPTPPIPSGPSAPTGGIAAQSRRRERGAGPSIIPTNNAYPARTRP
jgi:hypothetical protein